MSYEPSDLDVGQRVITKDPRGVEREYVVSVVYARRVFIERHGRTTSYDRFTLELPNGERVVGFLMPRTGT